jgi:hypothetical protein
VFSRDFIYETLIGSKIRLDRQKYGHTDMYNITRSRFLLKHEADHNIVGLNDNQPRDDDSKAKSLNVLLVGFWLQFTAVGNVQHNWSGK